MSGSIASSAKSKTKRIPVFVFPEELKFVEKDQSSHKQVLTVYNPYDFDVRFEVFSNAPKRYAVVESKGFIKAQCCVDIVVRHQTAALGEGPYDRKDKFRIDVYYDKRVIGMKLVPCSLTKEAENERGLSRKGTESLGSNGTTTNHMLRRITPPRVVGADRGPSVWMVVMALLCLLVLLLPLEGESSSWPSYLHITVNQKLIASFALGLVTMAILKS